MSTQLTRPLRRAGQAMLVVFIAVVSSLFVVLPASADDSTYLRLAHLSPDTPSVDVYVANVANPAAMTVFPGVGYGTVSEYQKVPAGSYTISMRPAGADPSSAPVIATTVNATPGAAYTIAGVGTFAQLGLKVLPDDLTLPPAGESKARVIQASASQPELDLKLASGGVLGTGVKFATTTDYVTVKSGAQNLQVSKGAKELTKLGLNLDQGAVYSVLVLDSPNGLAVTMKTDSVATAVVPTGGVETGSGGSQIWVTLPVVVLVAGFAAALVTGLNVRRRTA